MDERRQENTDSAVHGVYETGRTRPPKSHGGLIAALLVVVIFLLGLVSALSAANIRLWGALRAPEDKGMLPISFVSETAPPSSEPEPESRASAAEQNLDVFSFKLSPSPQSIENIPQEGGLSLQEIYDKNIASVVSITCTVPGGTVSATGVILSADGYIVTNSHVIRGAESIYVRLTDGRSFDAETVGADAATDLAVVRIEAAELPTAEFGDSSVLRVGDAVAAIGDPLGAQLHGTLTDGIVSAINRDVTTEGRTLTLIQTNAALNSGNSGGPLLNCFGQVIGINTMKIGAFVDSAGVEGIGFAIPSTTVRDIVGQLIMQGYVSGRPTLGITASRISPFSQRYYHLPAGLYITAVSEGGSASLAGIVPGDILTRFGGADVTDMEQLDEALYAYSAGDTVTAVIYRAGVEQEVLLTLTEAHG